MRSKKFWILVCCAFIIRIIFAIPALYNPTLLIRYDTDGYLQAGYSLAEGNGYSINGMPSADRPLGYPLLIALVSLFFGRSLLAIAIAGAFISSCTLIPIILISKHFYKDQSWGITSIFFILNITSIACSVQILSDTLFTFFIAWQTYFLLIFIKEHSPSSFILTVIFSMIACIVRPIQLPFILFLLPLCIFLFPRCKWFKAGICYIICYLIIVFPWMMRNYQLGIGFTLDNNTGNTMLQNASAILTSVNGRNSYDILDELRQQAKELESNSLSKSNAKWIIYKNTIKKYPYHFFKTHLPSPLIFVPDVPSLLENLGITQKDRQTLSVIRQKGIIAGIKHYFQGNIIYLIICIPLILLTIFVYGATFFSFISLFCKKQYTLFLICFILIFYYIALPGPVTVPRYALPTLPLIYGLASFRKQTILLNKE